MLLSAVLLAGLATVSATGMPQINNRGSVVEIWGSFNDIDECEAHQAIECLERQICERRDVPFAGKIRCTIGSTVAYMCNYKSNRVNKGELPCSEGDWYEAWRQIRIATGSETGWWYSKDLAKTIGIDRRCPDNECDNGWKAGSEGEQCTNILGGRHNDWLFDFSSDHYPNFTGEYVRELPVPGDEEEPVYFNPWQHGQRPK